VRIDNRSVETDRMKMAYNYFRDGWCGKYQCFLDDKVCGFRKECSDPTTVMEDLCEQLLLQEFVREL